MSTSFASKSDANRLLTRREAAELLNVNVATVFCYTKQGRIPAVKISERTVRYSLKDLLAFIERQTKTGLDAIGPDVLHATRKRKNAVESRWALVEPAIIAAESLIIEPLDGELDDAGLAALAALLIDACGIDHEDENREEINDRISA
jgi:excisionase family DNA binding protein